MGTKRSNYVHAFLWLSMATWSLANSSSVRSRSYAVFAALDASHRIDDQFCLQYYPHLQELNASVTEATLYPFSALSDLSSKSLCNASNVDPSLIDSKLVLVNDSVCSILDQAFTVHSMDGLGLFSSPFVNLSAPHSSSTDNVRAVVAIFTQMSNFIKVLKNEKKWKSFAIFAPPNDVKAIDSSIVVLFVLAVFTVALGSKLAGLMHKHLHDLMNSHQLNDRERGDNGSGSDVIINEDSCVSNPGEQDQSNNRGAHEFQTGVDGGNSSQSGSRNDHNNTAGNINQNCPNNGDTSDGNNNLNTTKEIEGTLHVTPFKVLVYVFFMCLVLVLLYLFASVLVYVVMAMFMLASAFAFYTISVELLNNFCPSLPKCQVQSCTQWFPSELPSIIFLILAIAINVFWFINRKVDPIGWILQDFLAVLFSINLLRFCRLPSFKICFILMSVLFVYDIFFVFLTPLLTKDGKSIMVEVATGGDSGEQLPMVLKAPKLNYSPLQVCNSFNYSLLGLGDILVPGLVISYGHVYDVINSTRCHVYWIIGNLCYALSLIVTFIALHLMQTAQPALLYIVPIVLITYSFTAACRREFKAFWRGGKNDHLEGSGTNGNTDAATENSGGEP